MQLFITWSPTRWTSASWFKSKYIFFASNCHDKMPSSIILNWSQFKKHVFVARWTKYDEIFPPYSLPPWHAMTSRNASCRVTNCFPRNYTTHHWGLLIFSLMKNIFLFKNWELQKKEKRLDNFSWNCVRNRTQLLFVLKC